MIRSRKSAATTQMPLFGSPWFAREFSAAPNVMPASIRSASSEVKSNTSPGFIFFAGPEESFQNEASCFAAFFAPCSSVMESGVNPCPFSDASAPRRSAASIAPDTFAFCLFSAT